MPDVLLLRLGKVGIGQLVKILLGLEHLDPKFILMEEVLQADRGERSPSGGGLGRESGGLCERGCWTGREPPASREV